MAKLIPKKVRDEVARLRFEENLSFPQIAKHTRLGRGTVSNICREEKLRRAKAAKEEAVKTSAQQLQSEAFKRFERGERPLGLVKSGFATAEEAKDLWASYKELKIMSETPWAYQEGHKTGYEKAKGEFLIQYPCSICGEMIPILPHVASYEAMIGYMQEHGWGHRECLRKKGMLAS